jgi:multisubunit Na+/H+ antiporter MnhE subunit
MLIKIGEVLLRTALIVFVLIPVMIVALNKANAQMMRQIEQPNARQALIATPGTPKGEQPLIRTSR